jgi:hypothetical protein
MIVGQTAAACSISAIPRITVTTGGAPLAVTLQTYLTAPLEREYESWFVSGLDRYFGAAGRPFRIWAVSPSDEATWPADEHLLAEEKLLGLQFKQAKLAPNAGSDPAFDRLSWSFAQPPKQFELIQQRREIFYCLPTFVNRRWKDWALDHSILWRPRPTDPVDHNAWYNNPSASTPYRALTSHAQSLRWGQFYEALLECRLGIFLTGKRSLRGYLAALQSMIRELTPNGEIQRSDAGYAERSPLYLLAITVR